MHRMQPLKCLLSERDDRSTSHNRRSSGTIGVHSAEATATPATERCTIAALLCHNNRNNSIKLQKHSRFDFSPQPSNRITKLTVYTSSTSPARYYEEVVARHRSSECLHGAQTCIACAVRTMIMGHSTDVIQSDLISCRPANALAPCLSCPTWGETSCTACLT